MEAVNKKNASIVVLIEYYYPTTTGKSALAIFYSRQAVISKFETPSHPSPLSLPLI